MKKLMIYTDASVIGGCEDQEFAEGSNALWLEFISGRHTLVLSSHTLRELEGAPDSVWRHLDRIPIENQFVLEDSPEASLLANAYLDRGVVGPGSHADALHVAMATIGGADVLVSWNFKHIVNMGKIRLFNAVNLEQGYKILEIRTPKEVLEYE